MKNWLLQWVRQYVEANPATATQEDMARKPLSAADVEVTELGAEKYRVEVREPGSRSVHEVTASPEVVRRLGGDVAPEHLIRASFEFLLEREPKESILARLDLPMIGRYFPEYPREIRGRLG